MLFAEMVCFFMAEGQTVYDVLQELFAEFGSYIEKAASMTFGGVDGMKNMAAIMQSIRSRDYTDGLGGAKVLAVSDYLGAATTYACGKTEPTGQPKTDAVKLVLENDAGVCARPSGTEPKLKVYAAAKACSTDEAEMLANKYIAAIKELA
jgi:phosphoglucomutase